VYTGKVYDLGGQVLAASSAPVIFHLAKETGSALEEMDSHKLAVVDPSSGEYQDIKVADDYVSVMSLTLQIQVSLYSLISCTIFLSTCSFANQTDRKDSLVFF
jgi:hypothetical protein